MVQLLICKVYIAVDRQGKLKENLIVEIAFNDSINIASECLIMQKKPLLQ